MKYHANPKWSEKRLKKWRQIYTNENALLNIERFNDKLKLAEDNGYKVLVLWSDTSSKKNIEIAKNFIENN